MVRHSDKLSQAVRLAMSETFEGMAFLELALEDAPPALDEIGSDWLHSVVDVLEPRSGRFALCIAKSLLEEICLSLYGELGEQPEKILFDTLGELLNTVAGRFLNAVIPETETFSLGLPKTAAGAPPLEGETFGLLTDDERRILAVVNIPGL